MTDELWAALIGAAVGLIGAYVAWRTSMSGIAAQDRVARTQLEAAEVDIRLDFQQQMER